MCGIVGKITHGGQQVDLVNFNQMRDTMYHRGPDGYGTQLIEGGKGAFGHRRLAIIDLSEKAKQPMYDKYNEILITFNGEIYNYKLLKKELLSCGHEFFSNSDTEVLIYGYKQWGINGLLAKLKGMYAFAIWDSKKSKIILARDRFGIKPLYYFKDRHQFSFASELKALFKDTSINKVINQEALADYFIYSYIPEPNCIWDNAYKLPPAHYLEYDINSNQITVKKYWELIFGNKIMSQEEAQYMSTLLLKQSVKNHFESDVPVGLFLSGGYDSSTLLMHSSDLGFSPNTFSLGFKESDRSEHKIAKIISNTFKTNHFEYLFEVKDNYLEVLRDISTYYDEPYAISSMITYYYVSKIASKYNKVVLAGDGGDELFGGYVWDQQSNIGLKDKLKELLVGRENKFIENYNRSMTGIFNADLFFLNDNLKSKIEGRGLWYFIENYKNTGSKVKNSQYLNYKTFLPNPSLLRADRSSMACSLEVRVPFLDHELFEFIYSLSPEVYYDKNIKKKFLKYELKKKLPKEVFNMPKYGFSFQYLKKIFNKEMMCFIENGSLKKEGIINGKSIEKASYISKFHLLMLELWFNNYN